MYEHEAYTKDKGVNTLFLEKKEKYKNITLISRVLYIITIIMMFLSIAANMIFGGNIETNIAIIGFIIFVSGLVIDMIPDFLEKDGKKVIIDIVFLLCIVAVLFYWNK